MIENENPAVSPVPPTAAGPNENVLMVNGALAFRWTGQFYEPIPAPPVAPSEPSIYSHDENALPDNELPGMWEHADYEGGRLNLLRELHDSGKIPERRLSAPASSVGELEWRDSNLNREGSGLMFEAVSSGEQMWWVVKDFEDDTWYLTNDWMSDELRIGPLFKTKDEAQSLANSLQRILSGAAE